MAIIRPPGHHAMKAEYNGYCFFNNVAIAAQHAINNRSVSALLMMRNSQFSVNFKRSSFRWNEYSLWILMCTMVKVRSECSTMIRVYCTSPYIVMSTGHFGRICENLISILSATVKDEDSISMCH